MKCSCNQNSDYKVGDKVKLVYMGPVVRNGINVTPGLYGWGIAREYFGVVGTVKYINTFVCVEYANKFAVEWRSERLEKIHNER